MTRWIVERSADELGADLRARLVRGLEAHGSLLAGPVTAALDARADGTGDGVADLSASSNAEVVLVERLRDPHDGEPRRRECRHLHVHVEGVDLLLLAREAAEEPRLERSRVPPVEVHRRRVAPPGDPVLGEVDLRCHPNDRADLAVDVEVQRVHPAGRQTDALQRADGEAVRDLRPTAIDGRCGVAAGGRGRGRAAAQGESEKGGDERALRHEGLLAVCGHTYDMQVDENNQLISVICQ